MKLPENPKCPHCGSKSQKSGIIATLTEKKQRYRCIKCGKTFYIEKGIASVSGVFHDNKQTEAM